MMISKKKIIGAGSIVLGVACGAAAGYAIATNSELRRAIESLTHVMLKRSKDRMREMSEEVALHTAQVTRNPKFNQDWVANQWESIGY